MAIAPQRAAIGIRRHFTTEGVHPYDEVRWERRDARITNFRDGTVAFEQLGVEVPEFWSVNATNILAQKYFRGTLGTPEREWSLKQVADRVVDTITAWGIKDGYFVDQAEAETFRDELKHLIIHQKAAFNSPVWFNIGVHGVPQQGSACQPYDAFVSTPEGLVPIGRLVESQAIGAKVLDAHGVTRIVAVKHNGRKEVLRVHTKSGHQLDVTPDHLVWRASDELSGRFVPAGELKPGDKVTWHRSTAFGTGEIKRSEIAEAALAGWLQTDGFVGQYEGTNRSLTIEAMTVTPAERAWVQSAIDAVFPSVHRHERRVDTQSATLDCRRLSLYGAPLESFVSKWNLRVRGAEMAVPPALFAAPLPVVAAYLRSVFQAEGYVSLNARGALVGFDMISEGIVRGVQALLARFGIFSQVRFKNDARPDRRGCWSLTIRTLGDRRAFADEVGFIDPRKADKLERSLQMPGLAHHSKKRLEIDFIEPLGAMDVYDIQTESGEYLSGNLRVHNCFILAVDDSMDSILNWYVEEGVIFKGGSGAGVNLSRIRSSHELLKGGGTASGPVSFMRGADASAGTIKSGGKCFREGTLVSTPAGWRPIEQIRIGDMVLTHEGERAVADFMPNGEKQCYRVTTREGYEVEVTAGHKFAYWNAEEGGFAVKPVEEFSPGDSLYVLLEPSESGVTIPLLPPEIADPPHATTTVEMQFPSVLDDRLAYVLGLAYGDGELRNENPYRLRVAFCKDEAGRVSVERFSSFCEELFGERPILLGDEAGHQQVGFTRRRLIEFLRVNGIAKGKADDLGFPSLLLQATPDVRAAFLAGVIDADGCYQPRGGWSISSIDREFLKQLQLLALSLGVPSKLKLSRAQRGTWQALYRLNIVGSTFVERLVRRIRPYSAKAQVSYVPSAGADKGWGYRPSLLNPLAARVQHRGGDRIVERSVGTNETSGYRSVAVLARHPDETVAGYARELTTTVQVNLESVVPTDVAQTYDIEVEGTHLLSANGLYASNTRRAAKMVILDSDHPDIEDFIWCKAIEERKARVLRDAGFDMDLDGSDSHSIQYQNANNSVRVTDEFMEAVLADGDWGLTARTDGSVIRRVKARDLFRQIAHAAWECADPGMQFDTTINKWHTAPNTGRINGSNPCSEYMHIDNSACNLASLNLLKYLDADGSFDVEGFKAAVEVVFTGQEIIVGNADYPTEKIAANSRKFRELGIGYANLGALLMANGLPYDSDGGRAWAGALTALMTGHAYATSAKTASRMGPFAGFHDNAEPMVNVLRMHQGEVSKIDEELVPPEILSAAQQSWDEAVELAEQFGVRNSQASVLAPTGCLVGGTLVSTGRGLVRLGSLGDPDGPRWQELDEVVATDEGPRFATKFFVNGLEPVVRVQTARGHRIQGTTTHRIKVVDAETGEWVWRRFADVREGDVVPMSLGSIVGAPRSVPLPPLGEAYWTGEHHVRVPSEMTPELAELVGYFMGDGSLHSRGLRFCVTGGDFDVVERLQQLSKECFGTPAKVSQRRGYTEVRVDSVRVVLWWDACGFSKRAPHPEHSGKGYVAHVPDAVLHSNDPEVYGAFVRGLFEADGDTSAGYPTLKNTSVQMVRNVQTILLSLGFPTTLSVQERRGSNAWGKSPIAALRLLNLSYNEEWLARVGFIGGRKNAEVRVADPSVAQTGRCDYVPLTKDLIDRLAPDNDRLRRVLLMEHGRGRVSRRVVTELFERTDDAELGHLLTFFYDSVSSAELTGEELTYDISVPENVTYVANGFVSHNTIGLLMDCDTTGVEPDLGLVKTKKLVGGGTMSIVNQTVPRALRELGYAHDQIDQIVAYIDEHKTIVGAPGLTADHLPVFACSMGDNTIHYSGHVRMMGAVQPFISGAISKTVNMPEEATVEDVEQLHVDAWKLGIKAVAIYRDNCKVGQPLSTTKKEGKVVEGGDTAPPGSDAEAKDREIANKIAELEAALAHERQHKGDTVVVGAVRERLPKRRRSNTFKFRVADCEGYVTVGEYEDGRPGEVFIKVSKQGSTLAGIMDAFSISISLGLQHGVPLATYVAKYTNVKFEPAGITDDAELRIATSLVDYIFRRLALDYLTYEERLELGVLSTSERIQPTLPGVEESATPSVGVVGEGSSQSELPTRAAAPSPTPPPAPADAAATLARAEQRDAPFCYSCGNVMQRAGSCYVCPSCGSTSGCS